MNPMCLFRFNFNFSNAGVSLKHAILNCYPSKNWILVIIVYRLFKFFFNYYSLLLFIQLFRESCWNDWKSSPG